ncbi:MAG: hypothetical protein ABMA64_12215 [Myxococcota bacterium]
MVDAKERPLDAAEQAEVGRRREIWRRTAEQLATRGARDLGGVAIALLIGGAIGFALDWTAVRFIATVSGALCAAVALTSRQIALRRLREVRGPWDPPPGGFTVTETTVRATRVVGAASGDEDYDVFLLYDVGGGSWWWLRTSDEALADPARSTVTVTELEPGGHRLHARTSGGTVPLGGLAPDADGDGYAQAVERGWVWRPEGDAARGHGVVASVPDWVRASFRRTESEDRQ